MAKLEIEIEAVTAGLTKGIRDAQSKLQAFGSQAVNIGKSLSLGISAPLAAIGGLAFASSVKVGNFADTLLGLEQQTGLTTKALQEYRQVTTVAGIATDAVAKASESLQRRLASGEEGTKDLADGLKAIGVSAKDASGNIRSIDSILEDSISRLSDFEDITERNQIELKIFGRSAGELAPLFALGSKEIENAKNQAQSLGLVLSKDALESANKFRIQIDTLKNSVAGITNEIGIAFIPIATKIADIIQNNVVPVIRKTIDFFTGLSDATKTTIVVIGGLAAAIGPALLAFGTFLKILPSITLALKALRVAVIAATGPFGLIATAVAIAIPLLIDLNRELKRTGLIAGEVRAKQLEDNFKNIREEVELLSKRFKEIDPNLSSVEATNKAIDSVIESYKKLYVTQLRDGNLNADLLNKQIQYLIDYKKEINSTVESVTDLGGATKLTFDEFSRLADIANQKVFAQWEQEANQFNQELEESISLAKRLENALSNISIGGKEVLDLKIDLGDAPIVEIPDIDDSKKTEFLKKITDFAGDVNNILQNAVVGGIANFAFSIGEAIGNGANIFETGASALLRVVADVANKLGQAAIGIGVSMLAIKVAFKNPFTAIAAGVALVALSGLISSQIPKITGGGASGAVGQAVQGSGQNNQFQLDRGLNIGGEFTVRGRDLVYVIAQNNRSRG